MDYSMPDDKWNDKKERVFAWFDANPGELKEIEEVVRLLFQLGDKEPTFRKRHWQSICACFRGCKNAPIGGRPPIWGEKNDAIINNLLEGLHDSLVEVFDNTPAMRVLVLPHSKSHGPLFNAETYARSVCRRSRMNLLKAYRNHKNGSEGEKYYWDGSFKKGLPTVIANEYDEQDLGVIPTRSRKKSKN